MAREAYVRFYGDGTEPGAAALHTWTKLLATFGDVLAEQCDELAGTTEGPHHYAWMARALRQLTFPKRT